MEAAREEIIYPEEINSKPLKNGRAKPHKKKKKKILRKQHEEMQKKYRLEKLLFCTMILVITLVSLGLLLRYVMITEARHDIHQLNSAITELKNDERALRIELETLSRSNRVELEAAERLEMIYPEIQEVNYVQVDSNEVNRVANHLEELDNRESLAPGFMEKANERVQQWLSRVEALF
ncbi:cell division protein FtsL [Isachenkonia alkalipeptolytica]|uniref:Cell division protein FtsL n=1 Tax=Isachenkonia alkalipeptolytica TaxID=2565777 RepID=A0AA44BDP0_9CLOT|nr:cell division protein FtsL [Isachenkonia alkalipeptolytica]NBG88514.1 hypothetical protein [Isachenkonia alkalipeptolytica]